MPRKRTPQFTRMDAPSKPPARLDADPAKQSERAKRAAAKRAAERRIAKRLGL